MKPLTLTLSFLLGLVSSALAQGFAITRQPEALSAQTGQAALFRVTATGAVALAYQWHRNNAPVVDTDRCSGGRTAQLNFSPVLPGDAADYHVTITDGTNSISSVPARLVVDVVLPVFTNHPASLHVNAGSQAAFSGGATGSAPLLYGWRRGRAGVSDGARVSGAATSTLTIEAVVAADTGWYAMTASNADGLVSSRPARLTVHTPSSLADGADFDEGEWTTGGDAAWFAQTGLSHDGVSALRSGVIGHGESTFCETTVYGPGELSFFWMASSEACCDRLAFHMDGVEVTSIGGEVGWNQNVFSVVSGPHQLRWVYRKDGSAVAGLDAGFVDGVTFTPTRLVNLESALDGMPLPLATYGDDPWIGQENQSQDGVSAARTGYIGHSQTTTLAATIHGPGVLSFAWKVSSEACCDRLTLLVDEVEWESIAGEVGWTNRAFHLPWGVHSVAWRYQKDGTRISGADAGWLDAVHFVPVGLTDLTQASDLSAVPWTSTGDLPWFGQDKHTHDAADALQSGPLAHYQSARLDTLVTGPGTLQFQWKVSSEPGADVLRFLVDSNEWGRISGEVDWTLVTHVIRPGPHDLNWVYSKDHSINRNLDAGFLDEVLFLPAPPLAEAVNAPHLTWTTGGQAAWFSEMVTTHDGAACARSGDIGPNESSSIQTTVVGPGEGSFYWKVGSEACCDPLVFLVDGVEQNRISGVVDWTSVTFSLTNGPHTLQWAYRKDGSGAYNGDTAWLDQFQFNSTAVSLLNPGLAAGSFTLQVLSVAGTTCLLEYKNKLEDVTWTPLPGVAGTGETLTLNDPTATNAQRFYRVRLIE